LSTLDRLARLLQAFSPERPTWKLQEIAQHLGWDKATAHRFLTKSVELRFLERDGDGNFTLGTFILDLSALYMSVNPVRQRLVRVMTEVRDRTGLTTQAGYLSNGQVVIALSEEGNTMVKASAALGARLPLHATAIGKVILAQMAEEELGDQLENLPILTGRTVVEPHRVRDEVRAVRDQGHASARSELEEGLDAVAVPLPQSIFGVPAGLGCSGPSAVMADRADLETVLWRITQDIRLA
jgi:DNA-binding IclR family transcriptional regulator